MLSVFRPRYGLRFLLIAISVLGVVLGTISHEARRQRRVVAELSRGGAEIEFSASPKKSDWMPALLDTSYLDRVESLVSVDAENTDLTQLSELKNLKTLGLIHPRDSDIVALGSLGNLNQLLLYDPQIDAAISFQGLKGLRYLHIHQNFPCSEADKKVFALRTKIQYYLPRCHIRGTANMRN